MVLTSSVAATQRAFVDGKFLRVGNSTFLVKGVSYGTFAPRDGDGAQYPSAAGVSRDFDAMRRAGINTVRLYTSPPEDVLDAAARSALQLIVGLPWMQHVAFLDDRRLRQEIRREVVQHVRRLSRHPSALLFAIGNEIPPAVVRWHGQRRVERFLRELYEEAKSAAPDALLTYVNYPPTEYLELPFFDVCAFNVYLHDEDRLRAYLTRVQHIAGARPLLVAEAGADSLREGRERQAALTALQLRAAFQVGACGAVAYAWTDEWWRGGRAVDDWAFGLVDRERRPKPALSAVSRIFDTAPFDLDERARWPRVSVVVCAYNAEDTIDECLTSLERLTYPDFEVIVVNDGSRDRTAEIVNRHARVRVIDVPNGGLSRARNLGMRAACGEIVAYLDADAHADPQWLDFLVQPILRGGTVGAGGPNVAPPDDSWLAQCVARAPGGPTHVLLSDDVAEHVPGCNMAYRRDALLAIDGFNPVYLRAGDDVDLCWRVQAHCGPIGFAPSALVWHRHRASIRAYWRQQVGYGEGEEWLRPYHPEKFAGRHVLWRGLVYSPLPFVRSMWGRRIHAGVWGTAPFPSIYRVGRHPLTYWPHSAGWQLVSGALLLVGLLLGGFGFHVAALPVAIAGGLGLAITIGKCVAHALASDIRGMPLLSGMPNAVSRLVYRLVIGWLHFVQPLARFHGRLRAVRDWPSHVPHLRGTRSSSVLEGLQVIASRGSEQAFWSETWVASQQILARVVERLRASRVGSEILVDDGWWIDRDVSVPIGAGVRLDLRILVEEHALGRCLLRSRLQVRGRWVLGSLLAVTLAGATAAARMDAATAQTLWTAAACSSALLLRMLWRLADCHRVFADTVAHVAARSGMFDLHRVSRDSTGSAEDRGVTPVDMLQEPQ